MLHTKNADVFDYFYFKRRCTVIKGNSQKVRLTEAADTVYTVHKYFSLKGISVLLLNRLHLFNTYQPEDRDSEFHFGKVTTETQISRQQ